LWRWNLIRPLCRVALSISKVCNWITKEYKHGSKGSCFLVDETNAHAYRIINYTKKIPVKATDVR
jgi:hypothetical protein